MVNEVLLKECIEKSLQNFYRVFGKKPEATTDEIKLLFDELKAIKDLLTQQISQKEIVKEEVAISVHGIKSILSVFGFEIIVAHADELMQLLQSKEYKVSQSDFIPLCAGMDLLLKRLEN